jgi:hypothetical protein
MDVVLTVNHMTDDSNKPPDDLDLEDGVEEELDEEFEEEKCSFCGRSAFDVERMVVQGGARICNVCIKEFHARLKPKPQG